VLRTGGLDWANGVHISVAVLIRSVFRPFNGLHTLAVFVLPRRRNVNYCN
jgi:hypothetical protein